MRGLSAPRSLIVALLVGCVLIAGMGDPRIFVSAQDAAPVVADLEVSEETQAAEDEIVEEPPTATPTETPMPELPTEAICKF